MTRNENCVFVFDTETTGFLKDRPYLVSIAYQVYAVNPYWNEQEQQNAHRISLVHKAYYIIKPPSSTYEIPPESTKVHHIDTITARTYGVTYATLVNQLKKVFNTYNITTLVAHNIKFDIGVLSMNLDRLRHDNLDAIKLLDTMGNIDIHCTQETGTPITKLAFKNTKTYTRPSKTPRYKFPKLCELYHHYFKSQFMEHCAESDTTACARCYFKMMYDVDIEQQNR